MLRNNLQVCVGEQQLRQLRYKQVQTMHYCRAGIWVEDAHPLNRAIQVPGLLQSNQIGELAAILVTAQITPKTADLTIIMDSMYVIRAMNHSLKPWEDSGWVNTPNTEWLKATAFHLQQRSAPTHFKWVKGHNGTWGNEEADKLANTGVNKQTPDEIDLTVVTDQTRLVQ